MRVDFQQVVIQTVNADRVQTNIGNPQVAESILHAQKTSEEKETQKKAETILEANKSEMVQSIEEKERKRKAFTSQKKNDNKRGKQDDKDVLVMKRLDRRI